MMASHDPGFLSPTSFLSPRGAVRKEHDGHIYCQDMSNALGVRYFHCINKSSGCKGRLKSSAAGSVIVTRPHTCRRPSDSSAVNPRPEIQRPQVQRQLARMPEVQQQYAQRPQVQRKQARKAKVQRKHARKAKVQQPQAQRPQVPMQGVQRPDVLSPNTFWAPTGGERKRHAGHVYRLQFSRPSGYKYYTCVNKRNGCPGSLSSTAHGTRVGKAHTCRLTPRQGTAGRQTPVLASIGQGTAGRQTPVDQGITFQPIRSLVQRTDESDSSDAEEEEINGPLRQLQMDYIRQKMEIGELTKQKLQLETLVLQRAARGRSGGAVAPPNGAPSHTQRVSFLSPPTPTTSPPSAGVQQGTATTAAASTAGVVASFL